MKIRTSLHLSPEALRALIDRSDRKGISRSSVADAALLSFLSADGTDRMEAAFSRRLDRLTRQVQRLERDVAIGTETLALFVRFWLTVAPSLPADAQASAQTKGRERYENFVEALARRLAKGQTLLQEIPDDIWHQAPQSRDDIGHEKEG
jgi:hypothetical protein